MPRGTTVATKSGAAAGAASQRGTKRAHADSQSDAATATQASDQGSTSTSPVHGDGPGVRRSSRTRSVVERFVPGSATRFHITPTNEWEWLVKKMKFDVCNTMTWRNGEPLPRPREPCWLLACKCDTAVEIARYRYELAALGWKLLTCEPEVVARIGNKANLHAFAKEIGGLSALPRHYDSPERASYPCMLKAAVGEHGRDVFIVHNAKEVRDKAVGGFPGAGRWLLQELCAGSTEHATTLLVKEGVILDAICTNYVYDREVYVWPFVEEYQDRRHSHEDIPDGHMETMKRFVVGFSGICNFNYKVRPSGEMCIFEVNARVGADIACDVPRLRAAQLFAKLDSLAPSIPPAAPVS